MNFFPRRQQRKIHPCSLFKRKSSSNDDFHRRRNTNSNVSENQNLDENPREEINEGNSMLLDDKQIKQSRALARANAAAISKKRKKASTPEELPIEGRTLNTPLISGEMLFAKKLKKLGLLKEHRCKYIDGI